MPTGLPPNLSSLLATLQTHLTHLIIYFQIPSRSELLTAIQNATLDSLQALRSNYQLILLTCRPIVILLTLITHYFAIVGRIVLRHTLYHIWVVLKKLGRQGAFVAKEVYLFQISLSRFWILMELGFLVFCVMVYLLRRFIKRRRYVERLGVWYAEKKRRVVRKYTSLVRKISETSVFLALLIPHLSFLLLAIGVKYTLPTPIRFIASRTYLSDAIALWVPAVKTILYVGRMRKGGGTVESSKEDKEEEEKETPPAPAVVARKWKKPSVSIVNEKQSPKATTSVTKTKKGSIANRWLTAVDNKSPPTQSSPSSSKLPTPSFLSSTKSSNHPSSSLTTTTKTKKPHPRDADDRASELLRYWVVYSLIYSLSHGLALLPIVGRISQSRFMPSYESLCEIQLVFFVWLRHMKAPEANPTNKRVSSTLSMTPTKMIYEKVAPLAIQLSNGGTAAPSSLSSITTKLISILDLMVFARVISADMKQFIVSMASESRNLFPALMTLGMPSLFTTYGCLYASAVIPACNSSHVLNQLTLKGALWGSEERAMYVKERTRWLKFYVIGCGFSLVLKSQESALRWIPFSTHATLLIWLWLNLPSESYGGVGMAWRMGERELVGFGFLVGEVEMSETMTMRVWRRIESRLPSAIEDKVGSGSEDGKEKDDVDDDGNNKSDGGNQVQNGKEEEERVKNDKKENEQFKTTNLKNDSKNDDKEGEDSSNGDEQLKTSVKDSKNNGKEDRNSSNGSDGLEKHSKPDTSSSTGTSSKIKFDPKKDTTETRTINENSSKREQQDEKDCQNLDDMSTKKNTPAVLKEISNNTTSSNSLPTNDDTNSLLSTKTNNNTEHQNSSTMVKNDALDVISSPVTIDEDQQRQSSSIDDVTTNVSEDSPNNDKIAAVVDGTIIKNTSEN